MTIPTRGPLARFRALLMLPLTLLVLSACAASSASLEGEGDVANEDVPKAKAFERAAFDSAFVASMEAAAEHFWHAIDCQVRDEERGMPTSAIAFPGQASAYIDSTEYTATTVFGTPDGGDAHLLEAVKAQLIAQKRAGYTYSADESGQGGQLSHAAAPDDHASMAWHISSGVLYLTFLPPSALEIPPGNPCIKPDTALLKSRFDAMREAIVARDEALFKAQWHEEGYEANLVGGSGIPGAGVFRQGSTERWVLEPDLKSARNLPQNPADVWIVTCALSSLESKRVLQEVWIVVADGKVLGGGETRDEVQALGWRFSAKGPLAP